MQNYTTLLNAYGDICEKYRLKKQEKENFLFCHLDASSRSAIEKQEADLFQKNLDYQSLVVDFSAIKALKEKYTTPIEAISKLIEYHAATSQIFDIEGFCSNLKILITPMEDAVANNISSLQTMTPAIPPKITEEKQN
jgi:hypothetical protein